MAIRKREAWNARHFEDGSQHEDPELSPNLSNVAGIVATDQMAGRGFTW